MRFSISALFLYLVLFTSATASDQSYYFEPESLRVSLMGRSAQIGEQLVFSYMEGTDARLTHLDLGSGKARLITSDEMFFFLPFILPSKNGFIVAPAAVTRVVYHLDVHGTYQRTTALETLNGWVHGTKMIMVTPFEDEWLMATLYHPESETLSLGILDLKAGAVDIWTERKAHRRYKQYWLPHPSGLFFVTQETGTIESISNDDFSAFETLRPPSPLIENPTARSGRNPFRAILSQPILFESGFCFKLLTDTPTGNLEVSGLYLEKETLSERKNYPLGSLGDTLLVYDWSAKKLKYVPKD
jgi:hypothetical protein